MPLIKSASKEAVSQNIKELIKSGRKPKEAIAIALSHRRQMQKMAEGGVVEHESMEEKMDSDAEQDLGFGSIDSASDEGRAGEAVNPVGMDDEGLSQNVQDQEELATALQASKSKANDNHHSFESDDEVSGQKSNESGLVEDGDVGDLKEGNKPDLAWINDGSEESLSQMPMKSGGGEHAKVNGVPSSPSLSKEAIEAIRKKRAARRYGNNPS